MSSRGASSKRFIVRLAVLLLVGGAAVWYVAVKRPRHISEDKVRAMLASGELVGLPMGKAAERLQHAANYIEEGTVTFDFAQIDGWTAGPLVIEVKDGMVTRAYWHNDVSGKPGEH
jgi:hypothetical protein